MTESMTKDERGDLDRSDPRSRADQSVALRFTRLMKASTSPYGVLTDPPVVAVATAISLMSMLAARQLAAPSSIVVALEAMTLLPVTLAAVLTLTLSGARARVVD